MTAPKPKITIEDAVTADTLETSESVERWQRQQLVKRHQRADAGHFFGHHRAENIASRLLTDD